MKRLLLFTALCFTLTWYSLHADPPAAGHDPVFTDTAQTITGAKNFTGVTNIQSGSTPDGVEKLSPDYYANAYDVTGIAEGGSATTWPPRFGPATAKATTAGFTVDPIFRGGGCNGRPAIHFFNNAAMTTATNVANGTLQGYALLVVINPGTSAQTNPGSPDSFVGIGGSLVGTWAVNNQVNNSVGYGIPGVIGIGKARMIQRPTSILLNFDGSDNSFGAGNGAISMWSDDGLLVNETTANGATQTITGPLFFGTLVNGVNTNYDISLVAFWKRALKRSEIIPMMHAVYDQWIGDSRPRCYIFGDSRLGCDACSHDNPLPQAQGTLAGLLQAAIPEVRFLNASIGGTSQATQAGGAPPYDRIIQTMRPGDAGLIGPGCIDIAGGASATTVETSALAVSNLILAQQAAPIPVTMISRQASVGVSQSAMDTQRLALNTWLANLQNTGAVDVADSASISGLDGINSWQNTVNFVTLVGSVTGADATGSSQSESLNIDWVGAIPLQGAVVASVKLSDGTDETPDYESAISVNNGTILQTGGNLSGQSGIRVTVFNGVHTTTAGEALELPEVERAVCHVFGLRQRAWIQEATNFVAHVGGQYLVDTSGGPITATLANGLAAGDTITLVDAKGSFGTNNLTIAIASSGDGVKINGSASSLSAATNGQKITLVGVDSTYGVSAR